MRTALLLVNVSMFLTAAAGPTQSEWSEYRMTGVTDIYVREKWPGSACGRGSGQEYWYHQFKSTKRTEIVEVNYAIRFYSEGRQTTATSSVTLKPGTESSVGGAWQCAHRHRPVAIQVTSHKIK